MSYRINVYTPQSQLTSIKDLKTDPGRSRTIASVRKIWTENLQLLGNLTNLSADWNTGCGHARNIMPLIDFYVSAEGRDLGGVLADVEKVAHEHGRRAAAQGRKSKFMARPK